MQASRVATFVTLQLAECNNDVTPKFAKIAVQLTEVTMHQRTRPPQHVCQKTGASPYLLTSSAENHSDRLDAIFAWVQPAACGSTWTDTLLVGLPASRAFFPAAGGKCQCSDKALAASIILKRRGLVAQDIDAVRREGGIQKCCLQDG